MKLIGSQTEQEIREQLIASNHALFNGEKYTRLLDVLKLSYPQMKTVYFIRHLPDQGEDLFTLLVNENIIANIESDRANIAEPVVGTRTVSEYLHKLKKIDQMQLAVALDLATSKLMS